MAGCSIRAHLFVRQVALNSVRVFLPTMPPAMVSGMVMSAQMARMITMVPKGSAAVDCTIHAACHCNVCGLKGRAKANTLIRSYEHFGCLVSYNLQVKK